MTELFEQLIWCRLDRSAEADASLEIVGIYHATPSGSTEMTPVKATAKWEGQRGTEWEGTRTF